MRNVCAPESRRYLPCKCSLSCATECLPSLCVSAKSPHLFLMSPNSVQMQQGKMQEHNRVIEFDSAVAFFLVFPLGRFLFCLVCNFSHIFSSPIPHVNACDQFCLAPPHCVDAHALMMLCCSGCSVVVQVAAAPMRYWRLIEIQGHALLSASWAGLCTSQEGYFRASLTMLCIGAFAREMHPLIRARYVLITHNSGSQTLHPSFPSTFARMCTSAAQDVCCLMHATTHTLTYRLPSTRPWNCIRLLVHA
jgi:hypothetical protein